MKKVNETSYRLVSITALAAALSFSTYGQATPFLGQTTFGGTGDEVGTGVTANASGVYFVGQTGGGSQGVIGQFSSSLGLSPLWNRSWPGPSDDNPFGGVALTNTGVIAAGRSFTQTVDSVGDKERKGVTVSFNLDGVAGAGVGGSVWSTQTPAAPGGFPYGGHEWLTRITTASEAGQTRLYTAGVGQQFGSDLGWGIFVNKLDLSGNVLWSSTASSPTIFGSTAAPAIAATGDSIYVASRDDLSGGHPYLNKYDQSGNVLWSRTSAASGEYRGVISAAGNVYAVGQTDVGGVNPNFLIESWDGSGNLLWSKSYDRSLAEDILNSVVFFGGHLFAVGSTKGGTAGGSDGILLDIDALTGNLLDSTLWGGAADDAFNDVAITGSTLYAAGSTQSFGAGGSDVAIASFALLTNGVPEPGTLALVALGVWAIAGTRRRTERR